MNVVLDTSVLVAAFTEDAHSLEAEAWLDRDAPFLVSDWAAAEFSAAIRTKVRQGYLKVELVPEVEAIFDSWTRDQGGKYPVQASDHVSARLLVVRHERLRAPDALHLAIALRLNAAIATFDRCLQQASLVEGMPAFAP
ncbi:type II toxin-antitoxin system VapC family toxin [Brevundimonas subvibrioides]|uniref:type II toxin-antitoxin system VapC family toxin n=1 Tax=Brevundimonas subvibrioides TaxID=74313 RepID=UPI0022B36F87|nr:type II toxin-antitoxin system VapC family toxin [Brevundimonas subvibrioides]